MPVTRVVVVGAGVIGLSSALRILLELPDVQVTIVADKFKPDTTGDGAAGLWEPYVVGDTPPDRLTKWCADTWHYLAAVAMSEAATESGVYAISGYSFFEAPQAQQPFWSSIVKNFRELSATEMEEFSSLNAKYGCFFTTFVCEGRKHLPYMQERFLSAGGKMQMRKLSSLMEVADEYDIIINCPGLGASQLVGDSALFPVKGHILRAIAPSVKMFYILDSVNESGETTYIIPNSDYVVLGGLIRKDDWNLDSDATESQGVKERCSKLLPSLRGAEIVGKWTGLRPARSQVRLELDSLVCHRKSIPVIHNYGHGGSGLTLFWGCAGEVIDIMKQTVALKARL